MKKRILSICIVTMLIMTNGFSVFAAEVPISDFATNVSIAISSIGGGLIQEGIVNLDPFIGERITLQENEVIYGVKPCANTTYRVKSGKPSKPNADGGFFWVEWGADRFYAYFDHDTKVHRTSCSNSHSTETGDWYDPGSLASSWIKATISGNKAKWKTK